MARMIWKVYHIKNRTNFWLFNIKSIQQAFLTKCPIMRLFSFVPFLIEKNVIPNGSFWPNF